MTGAKRLLILDGHSSYLFINFNKFYKQNIIICLCISIYASQLLQPLDVSIFNPLKHAYGKLLEKHIVAGNNYINKEYFLSLYLDMRAEVFTLANIYNNFTRVGLELFN
jgi:hypothetical protein